MQSGRGFLDRNGSRRLCGRVIGLLVLVAGEHAAQLRTLRQADCAEQLCEQPPRHATIGGVLAVRNAALCRLAVISRQLERRIDVALGILIGCGN